MVKPETPPSANGPLAQRVSPLVIESDGCVVPWRRGFDREFAVAHLARETLGAGVERWSCQRQAGFSRLCQKVHRRLTHVTAPPFFNWHDEVCAASALAGGLIGPLAGQNVHAVSNSLSAE